MNEQEVYKILKIISGEIKDQNINWRLEGSSNLLIQNLPVQPKDIDIATNNLGLQKISKIFNEKIKYKKDIESNAVHIKINDQDIEFLSYNNKNLEMLVKIKIIFWKDLNLPILPLKEAKRFYQLINRKDKVELIKNYL